MPECHSGGFCHDWYLCSLFPDKQDCPYIKKCFDCGKAIIADDDDAHVCIDCGGRNRIA